MSHTQVGWRRVKRGLVWLTAVDGALHGVVDLRGDPFGAILAVSSHVLAVVCCVYCSIRSSHSCTAWRAISEFVCAMNARIAATTRAS